MEQYIPASEEINTFFTEKIKPYYLSHYIRVLSDDINEELIEVLSAKEDAKGKTARNLYTHHILRRFEIKLLPNKGLECPARVRIISLEREKDGMLYANYVAKVEYDPEAYVDKDAEKKLRFLIAHELGHIFYRRKNLVDILQGRIKAPQLIFDSSNLSPDDEEEIWAWQFALEVIHHKDRFYHQAPQSLCYCCQMKIFKVCIEELVDNTGAKNKLRQYYHTLRNNKKIVSCKNCE